MQATEHKEQRPLIRTFLRLVKPHLSLTCDTHTPRQERQGAGCRTDRLRKERGDKSRVGWRNKAIKTGKAEGGFSPMKFTGDGYLTRLPVPRRTSAIPHASKKRKPKQMRGKKKGDEKRRKEQL